MACTAPLHVRTHPVAPEHAHHARELIALAFGCDSDAVTCYALINLLAGLNNYTALRRAIRIGRDHARHHIVHVMVTQRRCACPFSDWVYLDYEAVGEAIAAAPHMLTCNVLRGLLPIRWCEHLNSAHLCSVCNGTSATALERYRFEQLEPDCVCAVCHEEIVPGTCIRLACTHCYHAGECTDAGGIVQWVAARGTCPMCRAPVL